MAVITARRGSLIVRAYVGDNKTLLAFNLPKSNTRGLAGFTIACQPPGQPAYYLFNQLQFKDPAAHAQVSTEPPNSSVNAPIHKFRWVHVPGAVHQGTQPASGPYAYTVTPRYLDPHGSLIPLDQKLSVPVKVSVGPFTKQSLHVGFTRGYMQSQAFTHHFGPNALIQPAGKDLRFDTTALAGSDANGHTYTYRDEYQWMGYSARERIFQILTEVVIDRSLRLDMFAYDLNEPDIVDILLKLAAQGRVRIILDNAALHHNKTAPKPEDKFTNLFQRARKGKSALQRGKFGRYAHDKVLIVSRKNSAIRVLTGSTNFSVTGLYVNANHVLIFDEPRIAAKYSQVFDEAWNNHVSSAFRTSALATTAFQVGAGKTPKMTITFSPHTKTDASAILDGISQRIGKEAKQGQSGSVLFAVMQLTGSPSPVYTTLAKLHATQGIFSYGISDSPGGITLYVPGNPQGLLVTGKPGKMMLPPPFDQVPSIPGHEIHHKFVVCGFPRNDAVVYCGSSNLASGGEESNGDNLLTIFDPDVATAFAIEAFLLVDHYNFLDRYAVPKKPKKSKKKARTPRLRKQPRSKQQAAIDAGMFLTTTDTWAQSYYNSSDLHCAERELLG